MLGFRRTGETLPFRLCPRGRSLRGTGRGKWKASSGRWNQKHCRRSSQNPNRPWSLLPTKKCWTLYIKCNYLFKMYLFILNVFISLQSVAITSLCDRKVKWEDLTNGPIHLVRSECVCVCLNLFRCAEDMCIILAEASYPSQTPQRPRVLIAVKCAKISPANGQFPPRAHSLLKHHTAQKETQRHRFMIHNNRKNNNKQLVRTGHVAHQWAGQFIGLRAKVCGSHVTVNMFSL